MRKPKLRIQFVNANAVPSAYLNIDREKRNIAEKLRLRDAAEVFDIPAARLSDVIEALRTNKPTVVHFSAHGSPLDEIILLNERDEPKPLPRDVLPELFELHRGNIRLVVLNACFSSKQAEAIKEFVDCVIGVSRTIPDADALRYAVQLYDALATGSSVQEAHNEGLLLLKAERLAEEQRPRLIFREGVNPAKVYLISESTTSDGTESRRSIEPDLEAHRNGLATRAVKHDWWDDPIPLSLVTGQQREVDARAALRNWLESSTPPHCIIVGEPGAGKTGLIWWIASLLAEQDGVVLVVPAARLRPVKDITLATLGRIADPSLEVNLQADDFRARRLFLLLDGLDELVGAESGGDRLAAELLVRALACIPNTSRVVATCRAPVFALIAPDFQHALSENSAPSDPVDPWDAAIARWTGNRKEQALIVRVEPVSRVNARAYLERNKIEQSLVDNATTSARLAPFLSSPFLLRLLSKALPRLMLNGPIALHEIYTTYVLVTLAREAPRHSDEELEAIIADLRHVACAPREAMKETSYIIAQRAGLVVRNGDLYEFPDYRLWEYFFASELMYQIIHYDSRVLSRLDLVGGYHINRVLVPMVVRAMEQQQQSASQLRVVSSSEYRRFIDITGWRKAMGYGRHPSMIRSGDGTAAATFSYTREDTYSVHEDVQHGNDVACAISWYDAALFALHTGGRLATSTEIRELDCSGDFLFWCIDWYAEPSSHLCVYDGKAKKIEGLNPDVRLARTALAIVG
jgi:hypothetical protein